MRIGLVHDPIFLKHVPPSPHPENPQRLHRIDAELKQLTNFADCVRIPPRAATDAEILAVHTPELLDKLRASAAESFSFLDPDTYTCSASHDVARHAAGALLAMAEKLFATSKNDAALATGVALIRPPGHHAESGRMMGFCLLNNVAILARYAQQQLNCKRVAIVDFDVHHGNGTEQIFYNDPSVLYVSSHQYPFYPGTGAPGDLGEGNGRFYNLNFPVPAQTPEAELLNLYDQVILPTLHRFEPDLLILSAGYDAHQDDPLGQLCMSGSGFTHLATGFASLQSDFSHLKTMYVLEGGYNAAAVAASVGDLLKFLLEPAGRPGPRFSPLTPFVLQLLQAYPKEVWRHWGWDTLFLDNHSSNRR